MIPINPSTVTTSRKKELEIKRSSIFKIQWPSLFFGNFLVSIFDKKKWLLSTEKSNLIQFYFLLGIEE